MALMLSFLLSQTPFIGEDPATDTLHLSPRDIIIAMTALHGTMTGADVDALRLPLRKKLAAIADLPSHIVAFRGTLGRWFLLHSMRTGGSWLPSPPSPCSNSILYCLLWHTGQLRSKGLRPMPLTFCRNCITSSPTPSLDPLRGISQGQSWGQMWVI